MKAVTYQGVKRIEVKDVPDAELKAGDDILVRITHTSICGSDLHLYHGMVPSMEKGYVIGHEPLGIVEEVGKEVTRVKKGDKVVIPFTIACGQCKFCKCELESQCDRANPEGEAGAYYGASRLFGDYPGAQTEYLRVPYANFTPLVIPENCELADEVLMLLSDCAPTAYWSVEHSGVKKGDSVIVLGCGPIGQLVQKFAWAKGAARVIAIDSIDYRLDHAKRHNHVESFNFKRYDDLSGHLHELTQGGADVVIDCAGMTGEMTAMDVIQTVLRLQGGTMGAIKLASQLVRKGGTIQLTGDYGLRYNEFPLGDLFARNVTLRMGQAPVPHIMPLVYSLIRKGEIHVEDIITHRLPLSNAPEAYEMFDKKEGDCLKIILKP